jgi:methionyl-tRNA formyltransferase
MRVIFFGNHDVGIAALETLIQDTDVVGIVAHPIDPEEGYRFRSLYDFASINNLQVIRGKGRDNLVFEFVNKLRPDLIWVTDYRYILPNHLVSMSKFGAVNLHPSLLPKYRGRAPINWAIINGETEIGLTAHFIDEGVDTGDIIKQVSIKLTGDEDISNALAALLPQYRKITREVISFFDSGKVPRQRQDHSKSSVFPARKPEDGRIDWFQSAENICNLIRAVSRPYPGAFCKSKWGRIFIWKAHDINTGQAVIADPGVVVEFGSMNTPKIQCGDGLLEIVDWSPEFDSKVQILLGDRLL